MQLRPYQIDLVSKVERLLALKCPRILMQMGTGGGKTACAAYFLKRVVSAGYKAIFVAHLSELVGDTHARLTKMGVHTGFIQAGRPSDAAAPVQVCSTMTLYSREASPPADILLFDECHRTPCATMQAIVARYPRAHVLGLTATPMRSDGQELGNDYDVMVQGPSNRWLTEHGYLVPCDVVSPPQPTDDAMAMDPVEAYRRYGEGRVCIVFAESVAHAKHLAERFGGALIIGETPREERERIRESMMRGETRVVVGVDVFIEGWDVPAASIAIFARRFGVLGGFLQACGRVLRPFPGKARACVIDLYGSVLLHGLPDEDRLWTLEKGAVRTEKLASITRCGECFAMFRPSSVCPRCGANTRVTRAVRMPRVLSKAEKLEKLSHLTQEQRDARYLATLIHVAETRMRLSGKRAESWARRQFEKRFKRSAA